MLIPCARCNLRGIKLVPSLYVCCGCISAFCADCNPDHACEDFLYPKNKRARIHEPDGENDATIDDTKDSKDPKGSTRKLNVDDQ